jgi:hypothetical protein
MKPYCKQVDVAVPEPKLCTQSISWGNKPSGSSSWHDYVRTNSYCNPMRVKLSLMINAVTVTHDMLAMLAGVTHPVTGAAHRCTDDVSTHACSVVERLHNECMRWRSAGLSRTIYNKCTSIAQQHQPDHWAFRLHLCTA